MSLDEKRRRKREFESELKDIYYINIPDGMEYIYDNKVNKTSKLNLLHDILKHSKHTNNINSH